ncbi:MAG: CBS domain-containing protein [Actinomycetota bacterium]|nr:CBS domain-containing protein [Actinomycetota bacterium]
MDSEEMSRQGVNLEDIMRPAVSVTPDTSARAVLKILLKNRIPGVPVVDAREHLIGFVSDGHLLASALPGYLADMEDLSFVREGRDRWVRYLAEAADRPVGEVMSRQVSQVELGRSELAAAHKMIHDGASSVMVTENGKLVGIVNRLDLYAAVVGIETDLDT